MSRLIYLTPMSLDGYIGDDYYDWSDPGEAGVRLFTELLRPVGTFLYGRKSYETMAVWDDPDFLSGLNAASKDFASVWQAADKVIYSRTLAQVKTPRSRLEREFDMSAVEELKGRSTRDITIGGPNIGIQAILAGLVDEVQLCVVPMILGGGIKVLPEGTELKLELLEERRFGEGWIYLRYRSKF